MFFYLGLVVLVLLAVHWYNTHRRLYIQAEKMFHGPKPIPFLGNALEFPLNTASDGVCKMLMKYSKQFDRFVKIWLGPYVFIFCYDPKDVEVILTSNSQITKANPYTYLIPWIGYGLLTSTGPKWKSRRKMLTPSFHFKIVEQFVDVFEANGEILVDKLKQENGKPAFDIYPYCNLYALDNICETAMGVSVNAQTDSKSSFVAAIKDMCHVINSRMFQPWLQPEWLFRLSSTASLQKRALAILHPRTKAIIEQRRQEIELKKTMANTQQSEECDEVDFNQKKKLAFLDLLLESAGDQMTIEDIQEEVDTFIFEGHDTVTSGVAFALYCLSQNPEIQELVYQEQIELLGICGRAATYQDYQDMKYLDRVLKEVQRLYPSVPMIGRRITEDFPLSEDYILPKGCEMTIFLLALHRNPKIWPNPEKFDPDNFLPEAISKRNTYAYVPFSAGPRNCIGQRYAMLELKASVSKVIRSFKLLPCADEEKPKLVTQLVLVSSNGIKLRLETRQSPPKGQ